MKTLLLNANYEVLEVISERKAFKHIFKEKVDVLVNYDDYVLYGQNKIYYPSVLRLKNQIKRNFFKKVNFSRSAILKRDMYTCQYCLDQLVPSQITIDHILPKSMGGLKTYTNCVVCCKPCNSKKSNLLKIPSAFSLGIGKEPLKACLTFLAQYH